MNKKVTVGEIISMVSGAFHVQRHCIVGQVKSHEREIPRLVAIVLADKYARQDDGIMGSVFKMNRDKLRVACDMAAKILKEPGCAGAAEIVRKLEAMIVERSEPVVEPPPAGVVVDAKPAAPVSPVREKARGECKAASSDDDWFKDRMFYIDGSNVCHWSDNEADKSMRLEPLLWMCSDLRRRGARFLVFFDASAGYVFERYGEPGAVDCYNCLIREHANEVRVAPAGIEADAFILMLAGREQENGKEAIVVSNDTFSDYAKEYPFVRNNKRNLHGMVIGNEILLPSVRWAVPCQPCAYESGTCAGAPKESSPVSEARTACRIEIVCNEAA